MASTVKERATWNGKSVNNGRRKREGECYAYQAGKVLQQVTLLPCGRVASRAGKLGVISGLWGDLASRVQGATVDGKKGGRLPSRVGMLCPRDGW